MATKASISHAKYDAKNTKGIYLKLNLKTDADILEKLESIENVQGYIKRLIRDDMGSRPAETDKETESLALMIEKAENHGESSVNVGIETLKKLISLIRT